jgi:hypothetical protein
VRIKPISGTRPPQIRLAPTGAGADPPRAPVKRPSAASILLAAVPFAGMCLTVSLWDRVDPRVAGLPFNLAWMLGWIVLTSALLGAAYRMERRK